MTDDIIVIDFETEPVSDRVLRPKPIGVAIGCPGEDPRYYTGSAMYPAVRKVAEEEGYQVAMHNALFDAGVLAEHFGIELNADRVIDSMILLQIAHGRFGDTPVGFFGKWSAFHDRL